MASDGVLVNSLGDIVRNVAKFWSYASSSVPSDREFFASLLKKGKNYVVVVTRTRDKLFCPSRFAGYLNNSRVKHERSQVLAGGVTTARLNKLFGERCEEGRFGRQLTKACKSVHVRLENKTHRFWKPLLDDGEIVFDANDGNLDAAADLYDEGDAYSVLQTRYERNEAARKQCIEHWGLACQVCSIRFSDEYGSIGDGFIHVHHLNPIGTGGSRVTDHVRDLRPVCPNCHAMIHRGKPLLSINELRRRRATAQKCRQ